MRTSIALLVVLGTSSAIAQTDEWNTPFPTQPAARPDAGVAAPPKTTAPVTPPATATQPPVTTQPATQPATPPAPRPTPPKTTAAPAPAPLPAARTRAEERLKAATAGATTEDDKLPIVSKKERFEAGTEPHSPATRDFNWTDPDNARVTVGNVGIGTAYLPSARLGRKGVVRVSFLGEYLSQNDFPVRSAQDIRSGITFAASYQPFEWGEVFVGYSATANTNNRTSPNLIQALGDLTLGVKASHEWVKGLWAGGDLRLLTFSGVGNQSIDRFAVGVRPTLVGTYDVRSAIPQVPVMLTMNLGFTIDTTGKLVTNQKLNASEEFALGINHYNRFNFGLGLEVPLPWVSPFLEYSLGAPLGVPNGQLTGPDGVAVDASAAMPQVLGLGVKVTAVKDLTLLTGFNFGLTRSVGLGMAATPPWNFFIGASFAIDPWQRGETRFVDTIRERKVEQKVAQVPTRVEGTVVDAETKAPLQGAVVTVEGVPPTATDAAGHFQTFDLKGPKAKLVASREGYKSAEVETALEPNKTAKAELALSPDVKKAVFEITVTSAKKPVKATVQLKGAATTGPAAEQTIAVDEKATAPVKAEVNAGTWTAIVNAEGYLSQTRDVQVPAGGSMALSFDLVPVPKKTLVVFKGDKIEILQQVHFATGKSQILADSFNLLQQVVDVIIKNNVKRVRIEGHTDNRGVKADNQVLSENRARAVVDYLVAQGIDPSRLEAVGYGDSKPIAPNLTARGRELNRRVEFIVLEK